MIHEECGVFGMLDTSGENVARTVYYGLTSLQHRGQESCGIAVSDTGGELGAVRLRKDMGLVSEVFGEEDIAKLTGNIGIGHVRYSTAGASTRENAQPLAINYIKGTLAIAHNGNLTNADKLRGELARTGAIFQTTIDSELIAYLIARKRLECKSVEAAVALSMKELRGSYSLVVMSPRKLIAARDPYGFRPLVLGKRGNAYVFASESCALDVTGAEFVRDIEPGEIVTVTADGEIFSDRSCCIPTEQHGHCIFEYIYFARPDSVIDGISVYDARIRAGKYLFRDCPIDADIVAGVPESGNIAALGYSIASRIPCGQVLVKNSYIGRTFIKPGQTGRENSVMLKLNTLKHAVEGKRVVLIDDSIVRGTTSYRIVKMLRDAGAREVHMRISSPPFLWPCFYGTDVPERKQLIAYNRSIEEIRQITGADSLEYLKVERLKDIIYGRKNICEGCFTGVYPDVREKGEEK
ncbi:MAG: amidophosphoribosyltransferase [Lachnospiraceae bacterium]|nr:amidophosphoribosyltransferase [Lachnospiraceae bacterium]